MPDLFSGTGPERRVTRGNESFMVMTDPIADMLARIKNGVLVRHRTVRVPYSKIKEKMGQILVKEGFLEKLEVKGKKAAEKKIIFHLKYQGKKPVIHGIKRISKPGLRLYARADKVPPIRVGFGISILSTSSGLLTDKEAKKKNLGGEILCQVW